MTERQSYGIVTDPDWLQKFRVALNRAAVTVYGENPATAGHAARAALATAVVKAIEGYVPVFALLVGSSTEFLALTFAQGGQIPSTDLETRIAAVWNLVAGV